MGWADRAEVPAHALLALNLDTIVDDPASWRSRAARSLDFLVTAPNVGKGGIAGFSIVYDYRAHRWLPRQNPLSQAQTLNAVAERHPRDSRK